MPCPEKKRVDFTGHPSNHFSGCRLNGGIYTGIFGRCFEFKWYIYGIFWQNYNLIPSLSFKTILRHKISKEVMTPLSRFSNWSEQAVNILRKKYWKYMGIFMRFQKTFSALLENISSKKERSVISKIFYYSHMRDGIERGNIFGSLLYKLRFLKNIRNSNNTCNSNSFM